MSLAPKRLAAFGAAVLMVAAAVAGRGALDTSKAEGDLRVTVVCDPLAEAFCRAAADADSRLTIRVESPAVTTKALIALTPGQVPDFQLWVSVGPWLAMADGRRTGQPPLQSAVRYLATSPLVLLTRPGQNLTAACNKPSPAACLPLPKNPVGLPSPRISGIGLAGLAQIVLAATGSIADALDRGAITSGPAAEVIDTLSRTTNPTAGLEQLNVAFSQANPLVTTQAAAAPTGARAQIVRSEPSVRAVLQAAILDPKAAAVLAGGSTAQTLVKAAVSAGWEAWEQSGDPNGGLPEPGVLAALQDAWSGP